MKRILYLLLVFVFLFLCACGGYTRGVTLEVGESARYSEEEIRSAMYVVHDFFRKEMSGCELLTLTYDEVFSQKRAAGWEEHYKAEQAMVLTSSFYVRPGGGDGSLEQNETYENWQWVLTRSGPDKWKLQNWGYG